MRSRGDRQNECTVAERLYGTQWSAAVHLEGGVVMASMMA
jgi:hypothetical protein